MQAAFQKPLAVPEQLLGIFRPFSKTFAANLLHAHRKMPRESKISEATKSLLISLSEPKARRKCAKAAGIPTGAVPVLAGLVYKYRMNQISRPRTLYGAEIASEKLIRAYIRCLIQSELVRLEVRRGCRFLHPTLKGLGIAAEYAREIRAGSRAFAQA